MEHEVIRHMIQKIRISILLCLSIAMISLVSATYFGVANSQQNKTLIQPQRVQDMATNVTNIVLVHGFWADGSSWSKVIPILKNAGHQVIAVQLPSWFQVSENDRIIYPGAERNFAERMNATMVSLNSSHASLVSHPDEIAELILNATKGSTK